MSRPAPSILLSFTDPKTFKTEQILKATAIYAVFYDGQPVNLRSMHTSINRTGGLAASLKYKKVSFSNPGHAHNLKQKLNRAFKTDKFAVIMLVSGEVIDEVGPED